MSDPMPAEIMGERKTKGFLHLFDQNLYLAALPQLRWLQLNSDERRACRFVSNNHHSLTSMHDPHCVNGARQSDDTRRAGSATPTFIPKVNEVTLVHQHLMPHHRQHSQYP